MSDSLHNPVDCHEFIHAAVEAERKSLEVLYKILLESEINQARLREADYWTDQMAKRRNFDLWGEESQHVEDLRQLSSVQQEAPKPTCTTPCLSHHGWKCVLPEGHGIVHAWRDPEANAAPTDISGERQRGVYGPHLVNNLVMLVRRLAMKCPNSKTKEQALDYLKRKGFSGSPLRDVAAPQQTTAAQRGEK